MANVLVSTKGMSKDEWLQWRNKGIGGSDASVVCGLNLYKSPVELWMEKTAQIEPQAAGEAAHWGTALRVKDTTAQVSSLVPRSDTLAKRAVMLHSRHATCTISIRW